jgi:hypothetical protein
MKNNFLIVLLTFAAFNTLCAQKVAATYNGDAHTLTLKADNAKISEVLSAIAASDLEVFITDLDTDFSVKANFTNTPVDDVLKSMIPGRYHYFYRLSDKAIKALNDSGKTESAQMQAGEKRGAAAATAKQPAVADLQKDASKFNLKPAQGNADKFQKPEKAAGTGTMKPAATIKAGPAPKETPAAMPGLTEDKHLVVTFKVTATSIEAVSGALESGAYETPGEESASGDFVMVGRDGSSIVYAEAFANPLEARSIFDPSKSTYHKTFEEKETYVTVKMPKEYANANKAKGVKLEIGSFTPGGKEAIFSKREAAMSANDVRKYVNVKQSGDLDLSKITIKGGN